jgi:hypothetical protein
MLDYAQPLGRTTAIAGSGLGASLGRLLEPFDWPREALWNIPGKLTNGDLMGALPGLAGVGAGILAAALAPTGLGLPLGALAGSLVGGSAQGVGKAIDEDRFHAPTAEDVTGSDNPLLNTLVSMIGDPLSFAGGTAGRAGGRAVGRRLEEAALARGPNYAGGPEKLLGMLDHPVVAAPAAELRNIGTIPPVRDRIQTILSSPYATEILKEIPPGSVPLGRGAEAFALETPQGGVVRIAGGPGAFDARTQSLAPLGEAGLAASPPAPRVQAPEVLEALRDRAFGPYQVEHLPRMSMVQEPIPASVGMDPIARQTAQAERARDFEMASRALAGRLEDRGLQAPDVHYGNVGRVPGTLDRYLVTDAGAVAPAPGMPLPARVEPRPGGAIISALLELLDSENATRQALARRSTLPPTAGIPLRRPQEILPAISQTRPTQALIDPLRDELLPLTQVLR